MKHVVGILAMLVLVVWLVGCPVITFFMVLEVGSLSEAFIVTWKHPVAWLGVNGVAFIAGAVMAVWCLSIDERRRRYYGG